MAQLVGVLCYKTGRSRVRFPMVSFEFFIDIILPAALWPCGRLSLKQKWVPGIFPGGKKRPVRRADNLTTFMCRLSWNLGASTSWNPQGLFRPVMGLLYLYLYFRSGLVFPRMPLLVSILLFSQEPFFCNSASSVDFRISSFIINYFNLPHYNSSFIPTWWMCFLRAGDH